MSEANGCSGMGGGGVGVGAGDGSGIGSGVSSVDILGCTLGACVGVVVSSDKLGSVGYSSCGVDDVGVGVGGVSVGSGVGSCVGFGDSLGDIVDGADVSLEILGGAE